MVLGVFYLCLEVQQEQQAVVWVNWVLNDPLGLPAAPLGAKPLQAGQLMSDDVPGCVHQPPLRLVVHAGCSCCTR